MNKTLLLSLLFLIPFINTAQNLQDQIAQQMCDCSERQEAKTTKDLDLCFESLIMKNIQNIYDHLKVETLDDPKFDDFIAEVGVSLMKHCDYLNSVLADPNQQFDENFEAKENLKCSDFRNGDFYYLLQNLQTKQYDTTYVSIKDKMFLETLNGGKNYALLDINWINECEFDLVFKNSNDPIKKAFSNPGDTYRYKVVDRTEKSLILRLDWNNQILRIEFFKRD